MIPKLEEAFAPLAAGVGAVHIVAPARDRGVAAGAGQRRNAAGSLSGPGPRCLPGRGIADLAPFQSRRLIGAMGRLQSPPPQQADCGVAGGDPGRGHASSSSGTSTQQVARRCSTSRRRSSASGSRSASSTCWACSSPAWSVSSCSRSSTASSAGSPGCARSTARWKQVALADTPGRHLRARGAGARRRGPRLRPRLHQRQRDRRRSGAVVRVRARLAQPDDRQAVLRPHHPLHPPGDEPAGRAQADHLGRQLRPRRGRQGDGRPLPAARAV